MRRAARRLRRALGRRGAFLLGYGAMWVLYGLGQIASPPPDQRGLTVLLQLWPLSVWGWCWVGAGLVAVVAAWLPRPKDRFGFVALMVIVAPWMVSYLLSWWPLGVFPRGWVAAAIWSAALIPVAVVTGWEEPRQAAGR